MTLNHIRPDNLSIWCVDDEINGAHSAFYKKFGIQKGLAQGLGTECNMLDVQRHENGDEMLKEMHAKKSRGELRKNNLIITDTQFGDKNIAIFRSVADAINTPQCPLREDKRNFLLVRCSSSITPNAESNAYSETPFQNLSSPKIPLARFPLNFCPSDPQAYWKQECDNEATPKELLQPGELIKLRKNYDGLPLEQRMATILQHFDRLLAV